MPLSSVGSPPQAGSSWQPSRYEGSLVLSQESAEIAICWSQMAPQDESCAGCNGDNYRDVFFAMMTSTSISFSKVTLAPCQSIDNTLAWVKRTREEPNRSRPFAGLAMVSVMPM